MKKHLSILLFSLIEAGVAGEALRVEARRKPFITISYDVYGVEPILFYRVFIVLLYYMCELS